MAFCGVVGARVGVEVTEVFIVTLGLSRLRWSWNWFAHRLGSESQVPGTVKDGVNADCTKTLFSSRVERL